MTEKLFNCVRYMHGIPYRMHCSVTIHRYGNVRYRYGTIQYLVDAGVNLHCVDETEGKQLDIVVVRIICKSSGLFKLVKLDC
jgi:hypothetical protein